MKKFLFNTSVILIVFAVLMLIVDAASMSIMSVVCMLLAGGMLGCYDWLSLRDKKRGIGISSVFCFLIALATMVLLAKAQSIGFLVELLSPFLVLISLAIGGSFFLFYRKNNGLLCFRSLAIAGLSLSGFMLLMVVPGVMDLFSNFPKSYDDRVSQYKYWKASEYVAQGNWDAAIKEIDEAIALSPNDGRYYEKRGYAYLSKGDDDKVMADYLMMERYSTDDSKGLSYGDRGDVYLKRGEYDKAIADYSKAIELSKHFLDPYYQGRAKAYFEKNEYDKAWADLQKRALRFDSAQEEDFVKKLKAWNANRPR